MKTKRVVTLAALFVAFFCLCITFVSVMPVNAAKSPDYTKEIKVKSGGKKYKKSIHKGETLQLNVKSGYKKINYKKLKFKSSKKSVASVNKKGLVTGKKAGTAKITVTVKGSKEKAEITVKVGAPKKKKVESITISSNSDSVYVGESVQLSAQVYPADAYNKSVTWSSDNTSIATVDQNGKVTGVDEGYVDIVAKAKDGSGKSGYYEIRVSKIYVENITLSAENITVHERETYQLSVKVLPENASNKGVKWSSSDTAIATVDANGLVRAVKYGTAIIRAASADDSSIYSECVVNVPEYVSKTGMCGSNLSYTLKGYVGELELTISGSGEMYANLNLGWENYQSGIKTVKIGNGLTVIKAGAFKNGRELTSVTIPSTCTTIGDSCFEGCEKLPSIAIPGSVTSIGDQAFYNCKALTSAPLPAGLKELGDSVFENCESLVSATIPAGITTVPNKTFYGCTALSSVNLSKVQEIGWKAFSGTGLTGISIPATCTIIRTDAFYDCDKITSVVLHSGLSSVGGGAFACCDLISTVVLNCNLDSLGVFYACSSLTKIVINEGVTSVSSHAFAASSDSKHTIDKLYLPKTLEKWVSNIDTTFAPVKDVYYPGSETDFYKINGYENLVDTQINLHLNYAW